MAGTCQGDLALCTGTCSSRCDGSHRDPKTAAQECWRHACLGDQAPCTGVCSGRCDCFAPGVPRGHCAEQVADFAEALWRPLTLARLWR